MTNVVRLLNGGTIQVRTGVLQGIGPQGPRGLTGPPGQQGEQGPTGEVGPIGQILQVQMRAIVASTLTVTADTDTVVSFGTVVYDDLTAHQSSTNMRLVDIGDYLLSCYLKFDLPADAGDGARDIWFQSTTNGTIARASHQAISDAATYVSLAFPHRTTVSNEIINVYVRSGDNLSAGVSEGALTITRVGSGPVGVQGPTGPQGSVGATGAQGPQGPDGNASSGFATYADLL